MLRARHLDGEDHTIDEPRGYERFAGRFSWVAPDPHTNLPVARRLEPNPAEDPLTIGPDFDDPELDKDLWRFRRIAARGLFSPGAYRSDITLVNWPQVDYADASVLDGNDRGVRTLSLSFLHWMQTHGFPGLRLRADVVRGEHGAVRFPDSAGVGHYRIDLHPSTGGDPYIDLATCPFQLPLGALVPARLENLLAARKAIGTTHITNGAYRLHPIEWNAGEAAGHLARFCATRGTAPHAVCSRQELLSELQRELDAAGIEREWPNRP